MRCAVLVGVVCGLVAAGCGGGGSVATTSTAATATSAAASSTPAAAPAPAPKLRHSACRGLAAGFRCTTLTVPLHRRGPHATDGRTLALRVAVQRVSSAPRGDFLMLAGGPGQPGLPFAGRLSRRLREAARGYRLVFVDQRGTGATAIDCEPLQLSVGSSDLLVPPAREVVACARKLGEARDAYATADTVADLDALRQALGARRWTAGGISYGSFVAQRLALAHPDTIVKLVLDSVVPQQGAELLERVPQRATARVLRTACRDRASGCPPGHDPVADLRAVLAADPTLGPRLLDAITERSIGWPRLAEVTTALRAAAAHHPGRLDALLRFARGEQLAIPAAIYSTGLHAATLCSDAPPLWPGGPQASAATRAATLAALRDRLPAAETAPFPTSTAFGQGLLATCRAWPPTPAPPAPDPDARIAAPAILLAGDHDLSTPLEWARAQAARMPRARLVIVPGAGHSVLSRELGHAGRDALRAFLAAR